MITELQPGTLTDEQKEYLAGLMAGVSQSLNPQLSTLDAPAVHGTPVSELCKQERWKHEEDPLEIWDKLLAHAEQNKFPDEADTFRFRYHGLFHVAPAQNGLMLRCRVPAGELTSAQLTGSPRRAADFAGGYAHITR